MDNNPKKILAVDDEPTNLKLLGQILKNQYQMSLVTDSKQVLEIALKVKPDIVLLDVVMPGVDGYEVCKILKANPETSKIPVIFVTSMGEIDNERHGFEVGGVDYIQKPISPLVVKMRVKTHLAIYDQNRLLEEMVQQRTRELQKAFENTKNASLDTIHLLSRAAEFKDENTWSHIIRMSNYSAAIARKIGLAEKTVEYILYSAPLHDIGKVGTPDHILLKPGGLDPSEWEIMKQHTINGGRILEGAEKGFIKLGEIIAMTHHEKWDGSGYPKGLKGKEIPKVGQIVAIADVFDALTSKRPYKEPFPLTKAYSIIEEGRGTHFDPVLVDAFFAAKDEILEIRETYKDQGQSRFFSIASGIL